MMESKYLDFIDNIVNEHAIYLHNISQEIWKHPELKFEENFAHTLLTDALTEQGFTVTKEFILPTAFLAVFDSNKPGPTIALICEYDALPEVGHACGHNLIAEAGLGAAIAIKKAMKAFSDIPGEIVVLGTPAEEGGGGKVFMIKEGVFEDIDVALMVHPSPSDHLYPPFIGIARLTVTFIGKESHASGYPWEGINALDAAVACYNNISLMRQQIKPTCKIHGIISKGGDAPNVIPGLTEMKIYYRAATAYNLEAMRQRVEACIQSAATATGCKCKIVRDEDIYEGLMTNKVLAEVYGKYAEHFGVCFDDGNPKVIPFMASSDMGNVSHVVPSIHPTYSIGTNAANHSKSFTEASATPEAQRTTLIAVKALAMLGLKALSDKEFLNEVKRQFQIDVKEDASS